MEGSSLHPPYGRRRGRPPNIARRPRNEDANSIYSVTTSNSFSALSDFSDVEPGPPKRTKKDLDTPVVPTTKKPPPILLPGLTLLELTKLLKDVPISASNYTKRLTQSGIKLYTTTVETYKLLKASIIKSKAAFITYSLPEELQSHFILYGLPEIDMNIILQEIKSKLGKQPLGIKKMKLNKRRYVGQTQYRPLLKIKVCYNFATTGRIFTTYTRN